MMNGMEKIKNKNYGETSAQNGDIILFVAHRKVDC